MVEADRLLRSPILNMTMLKFEFVRIKRAIRTGEFCILFGCLISTEDDRECVNERICSMDYGIGSSLIV